MAMENLHFDVKYINYEVDFNTVMDGINQYKKNIYTLDQNNKKVEIQVEYFKEVTITENEQYISVNKQPVKPFESFDDYNKRLHNDIDLMIKNAADSNRVHQYGCVTTISRGYDAPCCAAVAKKAGCDTAITFCAEGKYKDDCGTEIARCLGYSNIVEVDANSYKQRSDIVEAEYICTGELGAQISFSSFDEWVNGNILFTGERGDSIWGRECDNRNNEFCFMDMLSHLGTSERRLWLNCISVPMPLYGASAWESIYDISNSDEMKPWSTGNHYDRPVPRRIIENAGVAREMFGTEKHRAGFVYKFDWLKRICARMSKPAAVSFQQYVSAHKYLRVISTAVFFWKLRGVYLNQIGIRSKRIDPRSIGKISNPMASSLLIPWAGIIMKEKYLKILKGQIKNEHINFECRDSQ